MTHITTIEVSNFKGIDNLKCQLEQHINIIAGQNAQGKSSLLDATQISLCGFGDKAGKKQSTILKTEKLVKNGETEAKIKLYMSDGLIIQTTIDASKEGSVGCLKQEIFKMEDGKEVVATTEDLQGYSVANFLIRYCGLLGLDVDNFLNAEPEQQQLKLLSILGVDNEINTIDSALKSQIKTREEVGRDVKKNKGAYDSIIVNEEVLDSEIDVVEVSKQIQDIKDFKADFTKQQERMQEFKKQEIILYQSQEELGEQIFSLRQQLQKLESNFSKNNAIKLDYSNEANKIRGELVAIQPELEAKEAQAVDLQNQLNNATEHNKKLQEQKMLRKQKDSAQSAYLASEQDYNNLSTEISKLRLQKTTILSNACKKIDGLEAEVQESVNSVALKYKGVDFTGLSQAEQIKLSLKIILTEKPNYAGVLIKGASLLDKASTEEIVSEIVKKDCQVFLEKVADAPSNEFTAYLVNGKNVLEKQTPESNSKQEVLF